MRRREFIAVLGGAAVWPLTARAQQGTKIPRIGVLAPGRSEGPDASRATLDSLVAGLRELGYTEGQNIAIERRFAESNLDRLREVAAELVESKVDVIVALSTTAARPAKQATSLIAIVPVGAFGPDQAGEARRLRFRAKLKQHADGDRQFVRARIGSHLIE